MRITRCGKCGLFAWRELNEPDECRTLCFKADRLVPQYWWAKLLAPDSGLIVQSDRLRNALHPLRTEVYDELVLAAGLEDGMASLFLHGVGECLQMMLAHNTGDDLTAREITLRLSARHDRQAQREIWRYATLLQGLAAGRLPIRRYWDLRGLLHEVLVPSTAQELLDRIKVDSRFSFVWKLIIGVVS